MPSLEAQRLYDKLTQAINGGNAANLLLSVRDEPELQEALTLKDDFGNDVLMLSIVGECDSSMALSLITHGADIHTVDKDGRTTLMNASWKRRIDVVERLLQDKCLAGTKDRRGRNIWHHVASDSNQIWDQHLLKLLFTIDENDASVNATDNQDRTSLHISSIFGNQDIAKALVGSKRAIVDAVEPNENKTALHFAAAYGYSAIVQLLVDHNANRSAACNGNLTPLHLACGSKSDDVNAVKILLAEKPEIQLNARTEDNMTPLHIAAGHGHIGIVDTLLAYPRISNVNARCQGGWTALHLACGRRLGDRTSIDLEKTKGEDQHYTDVVQALLSAGVGVNKKSYASRTALHIAAEFGHVEIVKLLLAEKDIQFAAKDRHGNTPLLDAAKSGQRNEILPLLAPWTDQSVKALPGDVKQTAGCFDANVIDFQKATGTKPRRHKIPVFDLLYKPFLEAGAVSRKHVSTRPDPKEGSFRWIHLPANNLHWCHTLLTKHFIEREFADVDGFKALERSLSQRQHRGRKLHSHFMHPLCTDLSRRPGSHGHLQDDSSRGTRHESVGFMRPVRVNSSEVTEPDTAPPSPREFTSERDQDPSGFRHFKHGSPENGGIQNLTLARQSAHFGNRTANGHASEVLGKGDRSDSATNTKSPQDSDSTPNDSASKAYLFMPYLALESSESVEAMHKRLPSKPSTTEGNPSGRSSGSSVTLDPLKDRDAQLHQAYSEWTANDYGLHIRRTLDQFWYRNVDTGQRDRDQVVLRFQQNENPDENVDVLMVDQLWVWVLGPELIVTSFPQKWQQPRKELPDLLSSVLEELDPRTGDPVQSVYGLAACIVGQCMSTCDRAIDRNHKTSVLDMFSSSVGKVMDDEVKLFSRFRKASVIASKWVKSTLLNHDMEDSQEMQILETAYNEESREADLRPVPSKNAKIESRGANDEPKFVEDLLDIHRETELLEEVKDIRDELGILLQVTEDQEGVHKAILDTFGPSLNLGTISSDRQKIDNILAEQGSSLEQQRAEFENMTKQVQSVYDSITDLLDHKQKHANAIEARYARKQASDTARAGRTLMVFTIVTVIFLPLSFLAAFFAINITELPQAGNGQQMSLSFVMRNVVGVGLGTALAFVLMAWHHHRAVRRWRRFVRWLRQLTPELIRQELIKELRAPKDGIQHDEEKAPNVAGIPNFDSYAAKRQWTLEHLAGAFRVFGREGYAEGIAGHISVRDPEFSDRFWINPLAVHFSMIRVSDLICLDMQGNLVGGNRSVPANAAGVSIQTACHIARPDAHAICHAHSMYGKAWASFGRELDMISQDVCYFYKAHSVYRNYGGIAFESDEGTNIARVLGDNKAVILVNHGLLTVGETVDEAAYLYTLLEKSCRIQLMVESAGLPELLVGDEEAADTFRMASQPET